MRDIQNILEDMWCRSRDLKYFRKEKLTKEDIEAINGIRDELNKLAGPEDIDAVKFIKKQIVEQKVTYPPFNESLDICNYIKEQLNDNFGVVTIPANYNIDNWMDVLRAKNLSDLSFDFDNKEPDEKVKEIHHYSEEEIDIVVEVCNKIVKAINDIGHSYNEE